MKKILLLIIFNYISIAAGLRCYICLDCEDGKLRYEEHAKECPDDSYVSCIKTHTKFAHHRATSRGCTQAPSMAELGCSTHLVNIMRATVCLCSTSLCNGRTPNLTESGSVSSDFSIFSKNHLPSSQLIDGKRDSSADSCRVPRTLLIVIISVLIAFNRSLLLRIES
ncbi:uncharacterized protein [Lepeophtheirus salmonis]|uniref:uncharacterized protein n=1 Tax=Lepeophtheirus salmonis TaxID=72036 RepID=UPI001AE61B14|nr:uncharacterized protein LOC121115955 [Lepeophtheirus salmonis]XP_040566076.1 uncharacterized protein LOC121115955 [Lepeophtheirus salmonis]